MKLEHRKCQSNEGLGGLGGGRGLACDAGPANPAVRSGPLHHAHMKCGICCDKESKYKCPTCGIRYCGLPCFKKHKEVPCGATKDEVKDVEPSVPPLSSSPPSTDQITAGTAPQLSSLSISIPKAPESSEEEPGPRVKVAKRTWDHVASSDGALSASQLELLRTNPELVSTLQSTRLQQQIMEILTDESTAEKKLESVLQTTPEFAEFVQSMLFHLGLRDSAGVSTM